MVNPTQITGAPSVAQNVQPTAGPSAGSDFTTFLKLLTTQIQNQDPLNPQDPSDFAVQLATFSSVEQQTLTNKLLNGMVSQQGVGQAANWIGKETRTTKPIWLGNEPVVLDLEPVSGANNAHLIVLDAAGKEVSRQKIRAETGEFEWTGVDAEGKLLPKGQYSFRLESMVDDAPIGLSDVGVFTRITGVRNGPTGAELLLSHQTTAAMSEIDLLREPRQ